MLVPTNKPNVPNPQSERLTPCIECGVPTPYKTTNRVCCATCSKARRLQSYRKAADVQRRKKGIECQAVGLEAPCRRCGLVFVRTKVRAVFCVPCRPKTVMDRRNEIWATSPSYAVNSRMSNAIKDSLRDGKGGRSWEALVGYTLSDLMLHLERQLTRKMSWANRNTYWEIEHIRPVSSFEITDPDCQGFRDCWNLLNLRPWPKTLNRAKRDKRLFLL